jgi:hypothetical protein
LSKTASQRGLGIGGGSKVMGLPNGVYETSRLHSSVFPEGDLSEMACD